MTTTHPLLAALLCFASLAASLNVNAQTASVAQAVKVVSLEAARDALDKSSAIVIDIREPSEHATGVAKGAKLIPMSQLSQRIKEVPQGADQPVLLICNTQNRSARVADQLRAAGYSNISCVHGGMSQRAARSWPMVKP
jgi:rhodanese-related sulfurtransferase